MYLLEQKTFTKFARFSLNTWHKIFLQLKFALDSLKSSQEVFKLADRVQRQYHNQNEYNQKSFVPVNFPITIGAYMEP